MTSTDLKSYEDQAWALVGLLPGTEGYRMRALKELDKVGLPGPRSEDWRYTNLKALKSDPVPWMAKGRWQKAGAMLTALDNDAISRFVFVNGRYYEELSNLCDNLEKARVRVLPNHLMSNTLRADDLATDGDGVALMNTALMRDGLAITIPAGVIIHEPIEILHIAIAEEKSAQHLRHVIELGEGAKATVIERYMGHDGSEYWSNTISHARVCEHASLTHLRVQEEGKDAVHTSTAHVRLDANANYKATTLSVGGKTARFNSYVSVLGEGADACVDGAALGATGTSHDTLTHITHAVPNATSDQVFRAVSDARGTTSFQGKVTVADGAVGTNADQSFKALLLDRTGEANAKPELEIFNDDVKCSHGATIGELDDNALFYMTSRGIEPEIAKQLLIEAFTGDAFARMEEGKLKDAMVERAARWMHKRLSNDTLAGESS